MFRSVIAGCLLFLANISSAESLLVIPEQFKFVSINEMRFDKQDHSTEFQIAPGVNKVTLRYEDVINSTNSIAETVVSREFLVVIEAQDNQKYIIEAPRPKSLDEAREYAKAPLYNLKVVNSGTNDSADSNKLHESMALSQLKHWWKQADQNDRSEFNRWVAEHP